MEEFIAEQRLGDLGDVVVEGAAEAAIPVGPGAQGDGVAAISAVKPPVPVARGVLPGHGTSTTHKVHTPRADTPQAADAGNH